MWNKHAAAAFVAVALTAAATAVGVTAAHASDTGDACTPTQPTVQTTDWLTEPPAGDGWQVIDQRTVVDQAAYDETVIDAPAVPGQHYSLKGNSGIGQADVPPTPADDPDIWQANTAQEPHYAGGATPAQNVDGSDYVEGDSGLHYTSHGSSGLRDWFYFQAPVPEQSHVVHHDAVTHEEYKYQRTVEGTTCDVTPAVPVLTDATCKTDGSLTIPEQPDGVTVDPAPGTYGPGAYDVTYTADDGVTMTVDPSGHFDVQPMLTGAACGSDTPHNPPHHDPNTATPKRLATTSPATPVVIDAGL
jgi:hypothetical protein